MILITMIRGICKFAMFSTSNHRKSRLAFDQFRWRIFQCIYVVWENGCIQMQIVKKNGDIFHWYRRQTLCIFQWTKYSQGMCVVWSVYVLWKIEFPFKTNLFSLVAKLKAFVRKSRVAVVPIVLLIAHSCKIIFGITLKIVFVKKKKLREKALHLHLNE